MSFPKARVKRFNEIISCAPPVGLYDPKIADSVNVPSLDTKDERFKEPKDMVKMRSSSLGSRNGKTASNSSSVESLPKSICFTTHNSIKLTDKERDLNKQLRQIVKERNSFYQKMVKKAEELLEVERQLELVLEEKLKLEEDVETLQGKVSLLDRAQDSRDFDQHLKSEVKDQFQEKIRTLEQKNNDLATALHGERQLKLNLEREIFSLKEELSILKEIVRSKDAEILELRQSLMDAESAATDERSEVDHLKSALANLECHLAMIEESATVQDSTVIVLNSMLDKREDSLRKAEERAVTLTQELETKTKEHSSQLLSEKNLVLSLEEELSRKKESLNEMMTKVDDMVFQVENYKQTIASLKETHAVEISSKESQIRELAEVVSTSGEESKQKEERLNDVTNKMEDLVLHVENCEQTIASLEKSLAVEISVKETRIQELLETVDFSNKSGSSLAAKLEKLEMESKIVKLDFEKELGKRDDRVRELENQLNLEKRRYLLLEGRLGEKQTESETKVEILTRKLKESECAHQSSFSRIAQLEAEAEELRKVLTGLESDNGKLREEVENLRCSEEERRRFFEEECSFLLGQVDETKARLESTELERWRLADALMNSRADYEAKTSELVKAFEMSKAEVKRIMKDHIALGQDHQKAIFELQELRSSHENSTNDLKTFYQEELKRNHLEAENKMAKLKEGYQRWKILYEEQSQKIEPFKELLEKYELEKQVLQCKNESVQKEVDKLNTKYADMFGHQNHKQKIQHLSKLKKENTSLKEEIAKIQAKETMNRRRIEKLTGQLEAYEGKMRFNPSTAFGLHRNYGGEDDDTNDRRVTYDTGRPASANLPSFTSARPR